jgi:hypothetical protein
MLSLAVIKALQIFGISIIISLLVAVLIKVLVAVTARLERVTALKEPPQGNVCPVFLGIPDEDVAALSAAIFTVIGPHRILHIADTSHAWSSHGRAAQHTSHAGHHRPKF